MGLNVQAINAFIYHRIFGIQKTRIVRLNAQPTQNDTEHTPQYKTLTEKEQSNKCRHMTNFQIKYLIDTGTGKKKELNFTGITLRWKVINMNTVK